MSQIQLYDLIPAIYRIRDGEHQGQLRALLSILESELRLIEGDIDHLYDNWFIETCDPWVVPYIGDLFAVRDLSEVAARLDRQERRAYVANTLSYRQRKGTTAILEQLGRDITGWGARAVEAQPFVISNQHLSHIRPQSGTVNLRGYRPPDPLALPFQTTGSFIPEVRSASLRRGRYTPMGVGLYLWRLQSYAIDRSTPRAVAGRDAEPQGRYFTFHPFGLDTPLFNNPQTETDITELAQEKNVPGQLTENLWRSYEDSDRPVQVYWNGRLLAASEILLADLEQWQASPTDDSQKAAIDLNRGRLALFTEAQPDRLEVSYSYGFSGDVGGGPYSRTGDTILDTISSTTHWVKEVSSTQTNAEQALMKAVEDWNRYAREWQRSYDGDDIPLSQIAIDAEREVALLAGSGSGGAMDDRSTSMSRLFPRFQPGTISGLMAIARMGEMEVLVTAGKGVDATGQGVELLYNQRVYVGRYRGQRVILYLHCLPRPTQNSLRWVVRALPESRSGEIPRASLRLGRLDLDSSGCIQNLDLSMRQPFAPGVIEGFKVSLVSRSTVSLPTLPSTHGASPASASSPVASSAPQVILSSGTAINRQGEKITFPTGTSVPLPAEPNQVVFLVLKPGSQTRAIHFLRDVQGGLILLRGNGSFPSSLQLRIPAAKRLSVVAADGDRPHLQGEIRLLGTATPDTEDGGEFTLEGIWLEGKLTVLPGNVQRVEVAHSTLSLTQGLEVQRHEIEVQDADPSDVTLLAMLMYSLTLLQRLLRVGLGTNQPLQTRFYRMVDLWSQQLATLLHASHHFLARWSPPPALPPALGEELPAPQQCYPDPPILNLEEDNSRLTLSLRRCISGAITLAPSVPRLTLTDCIVDARSPHLMDTSMDGNDLNLNQQQAIAAPGTGVDVKTSTLFGTTTVCTLDAQESLFLGKVVSQRRQAGDLRFCYVPQGSRTPPRFRCQPDLALLSELGTLPVAIAALTQHPITGELLAGTAGQGVHRLIPVEEQGDIWVPLSNGLSNPTITTLKAFTLPGVGTIEQETSTGGAPTDGIVGTATTFTQDFRPGDAIAVENQVRIIRAVFSDTRLRLEIPFDRAIPAGTPFLRSLLLASTPGGQCWRAITHFSEGSGRISSTGTTPDRASVIGCGSAFTSAMEGAAGAIRATMIVGDQRRSIRRVISPSQVTIDAPFPDDFAGADYLLRQGEAVTVGQGTISATRDRHQVTGCDTQFQSQVMPGDGLVLGNQIRTVLAVQQDNLLYISPAWSEDVIQQPYRLARTRWEVVAAPVVDGTTGEPMVRNTDITAIAPYTYTATGTVTSHDTTVTGQGTRFPVELRGATTLTVAGQTRRIVAIATDGQTLTLNAPFVPNVATPTPFQVDSVLATTAGGGVLRSFDGGQTWETLNQGLTHLDVRAIAIHPTDGTLWVGTGGGGVFTSSDGGLTWTGGDPPDEAIRQTGLTNARITGVVISAATGAVFASTRDGVFRSSDGGTRWERANRGLSNVQVTALAGFSQQGQGTIASDYTTLRGTGTRFTATLNAGDAIIARHQLRFVVATPTSNTQLQLNEPFDPDIPPGTPFFTTALFAGTTGGSVFRSTNDGATWQPAGQGLSTTDLTYLLVSNGSEPALLAGTQLGSLFHSTNRGDRWSSLSRGLNQVDAMVLLLNQLQPRFQGDRYGHPGYAQLDATTAIAIRTGTENGSEMGVFHSLQQSQREENLRASLTEYLRFGIQPDLIYVT